MIRPWRFIVAKPFPGKLYLQWNKKKMPVTEILKKANKNLATI